MSCFLGGKLTVCRCSCQHESVPLSDPTIPISQSVLTTHLFFVGPQIATPWGKTVEIAHNYPDMSNANEDYVQVNQRLGQLSNL